MSTTNGGMGEEYTLLFVFFAIKKRLLHESYLILGTQVITMSKFPWN